MRRSLRTGWYLRVVRPGVVQAGAPLELLDRPSPEVTVGRVARAMYHDRADLDLAREMLACPALAGNWRDVLAARVGGRPEPPL
jgi:MOSC domain-containing protein YiiM